MSSWKNKLFAKTNESEIICGCENKSILVLKKSNECEYKLTQKIMDQHNSIKFLLELDKDKFMSGCDEKLKVWVK